MKPFLTGTSVHDLFLSRQRLKNFDILTVVTDAKIDGAMEDCDLDRNQMSPLPAAILRSGCDYQSLLTFGKEST